MNGLNRNTATVAGLATVATLVAALVAVGQNPDDGETPGVEVMTRGPIHEAFAEPVVYDPKAAPVVSKAPPEPVDEIPPDQKPEGDDVEWIPGYWAWDDGRDDFIWISGVWRQPPPGRQWVPGYWDRVDGGYQWVSGAWVEIEVEQTEYLPQPPASLEIGPNLDPPTTDSIWTPGCWYWQETRYAWRPGFWIRPYPNWVWIPAHYTWTPSGYLFVDGYWDRPIDRRGCMFAPVVLTPVVRAQPRFVYRPTITILAGALTTSLFVRPSRCAYYFGDYYAPNYGRSGIYPFYAYHQSRYGFDPIYSHYSAIHARNNPGWNTQIRQVYAYRRDHVEARPPHTYVQQTNLIKQNNINITKIDNSVTNNTVVNQVTVNNIVNNVVMARPIKAVAANPQAPVRFVKIDDRRRNEFEKKSVQIRQFQEQRVRRENELVKTAAVKRDAPRRIAAPKSPIVARIPTPAADAAAKNVEATVSRPPARPAGPRPDAKVPQPKPGQGPKRPEPGDNHDLPPNQGRPGRRPGGDRPLPKQAIPKNQVPKGVDPTPKPAPIPNPAPNPTPNMPKPAPRPNQPRSVEPRPVPKQVQPKPAPKPDEPTSVPKNAQPKPAPGQPAKVGSNAARPMPPRGPLGNRPVQTKAQTKIQQRALQPVHGQDNNPPSDGGQGSGGEPKRENRAG